MLRRSQRLFPLNGPYVYPFPQPFRDTPFDEDRFKTDIRLQSSLKRLKPPVYPEWMDKGLPGTGRAIGIYRAHPLSHLSDNFKTDIENLPRTLQMIISGVWHSNNKKFYSNHKKAPNPKVQPYLTGEPCPVYGWKVTDPSVIRQFEAPHIEDRSRYKPYVGVQERKMMESYTEGTSDSKSVTTEKKPKEDAPKKDKPLLKRLFFWQ